MNNEIILYEISKGTKGKKEKFKPIKSGEVSMYNCGPTVYNYAHIGNIRNIQVNGWGAVFLIELPLFFVPSSLGGG